MISRANRSPFDNYQRRVFTLSTTDVVLFDAYAHGEHFVRFHGNGPSCEICGTTWPTSEAWAADRNVTRCPGPPVDPVPGAVPIAIGGA